MESADPKILELTALYEISKALAISRNIGAAAHKILEILSSVLNMRRGTLTLLRPETGELVIEAAHGLSREERERGHYRVGEGVTGKVMSTGEPMIVPDIGQEPLFLNRTLARDVTKGRTAFLCVPVKVHGETIGALSVDRLFTDVPNALDENVRVLMIVASQIGQAMKVREIVHLEREQLIEQTERLQQALQSKYGLSNVIGTGSRMGAVYDAVERVSATKATVLIRGESGTGKELIARAIHYGSGRRASPFIKVNCAAIPESLLESELFGHEKGAFTGATETRKGRFELADGGTLFLDEIGDLPLILQPKFLRILQDMRFERVGGSRTIAVNVRIIGATHRDLEADMRRGRFRDDLYYRLNVVSVDLPPLRERQEDIPPLIDHFLNRFNEEHGTSHSISPDAMEIMKQYRWPGNVRELENCIERIVIMAREPIIRPSELLRIANFLVLPVETPHEPGPVLAQPSLPSAVREIEREHIVSALKQCGGVQARAATLLGLSPRQIGYKIQKYNIRWQIS